jgi:quercetin dioxygenase-like cupin family protein
MKTVKRFRQIQRTFFVLALLNGSALLALAQQRQVLVSCKPASQRTSEIGCWILASQPLEKLNGPVYWTIDEYSTKTLAEEAKGPHGTVVESQGRVWLLTTGEKLKGSGSGKRVAQIGPLPVAAELAYTAQYMEAILQPGMVSKTHLHSGVEAFYTDSGETCLETPAGKQTATRGQDIVIPEGVPMELTAVGKEMRRGLILILHDSSKAPTTLVDSWKSTHLCTAEH